VTVLPRQAVVSGSVVVRHVGMEMDQHDRVGIALGLEMDIGMGIDPVSLTAVVSSLQNRMARV